MNIVIPFFVFLILLSSISAVSGQEEQNQSRRERFIQLLQMRQQAQNPGGQTSPGQGRFAGLRAARQGSSAAATGDQGLLDPETAEEARSTGNSNATARDVAYGADPLQKLDIYAPPKGTVSAPVILFAHGGGWSRGDKKQHGLKGAAYSSHGVLFISMNYRLAPNVVHPKQIQDIAGAFAWVKTHAKEYGGDPNRIYVMGHSAGAHLVDLLATNDKYLAEKGLKLSDVKGCISLDTASLDLAQRSALPGRASKMVGDMIGAAFGADPKVLGDASPLQQLHKGKTYPPFLMICSGKRRDSLAAHKQFENAVHDCGGTVTTKVVPLNHGEISQAAGNDKTEEFAQILSFVEGK